MIINPFYIYGLDQLSYKKLLVRPNQVIPAFFLPSACAQRELLAHFGCSLAVPMRFGKCLPANVLNIHGWKGKRNTKLINLPYPAELKLSSCATTEIIYFLKLVVIFIRYLLLLCHQHSQISPTQAGNSCSYINFCGFIFFFLWYSELI